MNMEDLFTKECGILEIQADPVIWKDCVKIKVSVVDGEIHTGDDVEWLDYYPGTNQKATIESIQSDGASINRAKEGRQRGGWKAYGTISHLQYWKSCFLSGKSRA